MGRKRSILITLLVLGLVLIGSGVWLSQISVSRVDIPEGSPVIYEQAHYLMQGVNNELYIYGDGKVLYIEEKGLRFPSEERPAVRTWRTGNLTREQLTSLLDYLKNSGLDKLDEYYNYTTEPNESGSFSSSDMAFTIIVNSGNVSETVKTMGYMSPDKGETYPGMPSPLNEIYNRLHKIAMTTGEVYKENIPR